MWERIDPDDSRLLSTLLQNARGAYAAGHYGEACRLYAAIDHCAQWRKVLPTEWRNAIVISD